MKAKLQRDAGSSKAQQDAEQQVKRIQCPPTRELLARKMGNLEFGGQEPGGKASLRVVHQTPYDVMDAVGAFDADYGSSLALYRQAYESIADALGARYGAKQARGGNYYGAGIEIQALYTQLVRRLKKPTLSMLTMLSDPVGDGVDIEKLKTYLLPQQPAAERALLALEAEIAAIKNDFEKDPKNRLTDA